MRYQKYYLPIKSYMDQGNIVRVTSQNIFINERALYDPERSTSENGIVERVYTLSTELVEDDIFSNVMSGVNLARTGSDALYPTDMEHFTVFKLVFKYLRQHPYFSSVSDFVLINVLVNGHTFNTSFSRKEDRFGARDILDAIKTDSVNPPKASYHLLGIDEPIRSVKLDRCHLRSPVWKLMGLFDGYYRFMCNRVSVSLSEYNEFMLEHSNTQLETSMESIMEDLSKIVSTSYGQMGYVWNGYFSYINPNSFLFQTWKETLPITKENVTKTLSYKLDEYRGKSWSKKSLKEAILNLNRTDRPVETDQCSSPQTDKLSTSDDHTPLRFNSDGIPLTNDGLPMSGFGSNPYTNSEDVLRYKKFRSLLKKIVDSRLEDDILFDNPSVLITDYFQHHPSLISHMTYHKDCNTIYYLNILRNHLK